MGAATPLVAGGQPPCIDVSTYQGYSLIWLQDVSGPPGDCLRQSTTDEERIGGLAVRPDGTRGMQATKPECVVALVDCQALTRETLALGLATKGFRVARLADPDRARMAF